MNIIDAMNNRQTITITGNPDGLDEETLKKVNDLRAKRNEFQKQADEVQKEIDAVILNANDYKDLGGKYLKIWYTNEDSNHTLYVGPVTEISRLYSRSCRIKYAQGFYIDYLDDSTPDNNFYTMRLDTEGEVDLSKYESDAFGGKRQTGYEEITKEEFEKIFDEGILTYKKWWK